MINHCRWTTLAAAMAVAILAGCTVESRARMDSANADTSRLTGAATAMAPDTSDRVNVSAPSVPGPAGASATNVVTFSGVAPLRIGMSEAEARQALGMPKGSAATKDECRYLDTKGRSRAFVMLVRDTVARLDVRDSTLATEAGARVGDAESRVRSLYAGRVATQPHKYVSGGHYLVVTAPSDSTRRLVFETNGTHVTTFRVGRMPEVQWVEGCS